MVRVEGKSQEVKRANLNVTHDRPASRFNLKLSRSLMAMNLPPHVEALAQKQFKYVRLFNRYAAELRKDSVKAKEAYDRVSQTWDMVLKPGQLLSYPPPDPSIAQKAYENICLMEPKSLDE